MNIPEKIRIGGIDYRIIRKENIHIKNQMCYGIIDYDQCTIELSAEEMDNQRIMITLLHEILHGIQNHIGVPLGENEEEIIDMFARGIYQVMSDNYVKEITDNEMPGMRK